MTNSSVLTCCICGKPIDGYGNNPYPLCADDDLDSRCCDSCNDTYVIPARVYSLHSDKLATVIHDNPEGFINAIRADLV